MVKQGGPRTALPAPNHARAQQTLTNGRRRAGAQEAVELGHTLVQVAESQQAAVDGPGRAFDWGFRRGVAAGAYFFVVAGTAEQDHAWLHGALARELDVVFAPALGAQDEGLRDAVFEAEAGGRG